MKNDDLFREIGQGLVISIMFCLAPLFFVWEFITCIYESLRKNNI